MNNDEIQNAIEFLLKHQANFEVQLENTNQQIARTQQQIEKTDRQLERTDQQLEQTDRQLEQTDRQLEQTNQRVSVLAETQTEFLQTVLRHVEDQREINADVRRTMRELAQAQQVTHQDISELTRTVDTLVKTIYRDGNPPPQT